MFLSCCFRTWPLCTSILSALGGNSSLRVTPDGLCLPWRSKCPFIAPIQSVDSYTEDHFKALDTIELSFIKKYPCFSLGATLAPEDPPQKIETMLVKKKERIDLLWTVKCPV